MTNVETEETAQLIPSDKVEGTSVYNTQGDKLGSIYNLMIDKMSGQVEYAVLRFGGVLGLGSDYYPVPWMALEYDEDQGGYVLDADRDLLERAPRYAAGAQPTFSSTYNRDVDRLYGIEYEE